MTHKDIYTKFMIEYDKANVTSSYPSLTEYEVATVLDKAYNALIAQKVTGNNVRRSSVESDIKSISDLQPLLVHGHPKFFDDNTEVASNIASFNLPADFLYFVQLFLVQVVKTEQEDLGLVQLDSSITGDDEQVNAEPANDTAHDRDPLDQKTTRLVPTRLVPHQIAEKFFITPYNMPWIKVPVVYIENGVAKVVYDLLNAPMVAANDSVHLTYIRKPNTFVKDLDSSVFTTNHAVDVSYFDCPNTNAAAVQALYQFECNDTVAEELISLAVSFALENVESNRLNSKLNMRGLEA